MERVVVTKHGTREICAVRDKELYTVFDMAQFIALDVMDDYREIATGSKEREDTNIDLAMEVLTAVSQVCKLLLEGIM